MTQTVWSETYVKPYSADSVSNDEGTDILPKMQNTRFLFEERNLPLHTASDVTSIGVVSSRWLSGHSLLLV